MTQTIAWLCCFTRQDFDDSAAHLDYFNEAVAAHNEGATNLNIIQTSMYYLLNKRMDIVWSTLIPLRVISRTTG